MKTSTNTPKKKKEKEGREVGKMRESLREEKEKKRIKETMRMSRSKDYLLLACKATLL